MKNIFCFVVIFLACSLFATGQNNGYVKSRIYAVIVGISSYHDDNSLPKLKFPEKDAQDFYDLLLSPYCGSVPPENIALIKGEKATRAEILNEINDKFSRSSAEDMIIFYYSGHGIVGLNQKGVFATYDTDVDKDYTGISMKELKESIDEFPAKIKLSYVDVCHAGKFSSNNKGLKRDDNDIIAKTFLENVSKASPGSARFLASSAQQESREYDKLGHGVFTYFLLKGLRGEADHSHPGTNSYNNAIVDIGELVTYLTDSIPGYTKFQQRPSVEGNFNDQFPLSVLRPNTSLNTAIMSVQGSRPEKAEQQNTVNANAAQPKDETPIKKSKNPNCKGDNTGDFCFLNSTEEELRVTFYPKNKVYQCTIRPGQKQFFYDVVAGPARYEINNDEAPGTFHVQHNGDPPPKTKKRFSIDGTEYVESCQEKTFTIK